MVSGHRQEYARRLALLATAHFWNPWLLLFQTEKPCLEDHGVRGWLRSILDVILREHVKFELASLPANGLVLLRASVVAIVLPFCSSAVVSTL